ncbi:MAG: M28 family peptidase, partial [Phycisphaerae bacterium]
ADERPRRLIDLADGRIERWGHKDLRDAVVLLDFNSGQAWLRARELGAYAAIFIEPEFTTVFQADLKYLETVPLYMPRVWIDRQHGLQLRQALQARKDVRVIVRTRLQWRNVHAPCLEFTIPGKDRSRTFIFAAYFDARSIVPDLSYGGDEIWGIAAMLEIARYFKQHQPACDLRFLAVSGHWQSQRCTRDYIAYGTKGFAEIGHQVKIALGLDYSTENPNLNLIRESAWNDGPETSYIWLRRLLFNAGGWRDQILDGLKLRQRNIQMFAGVRPMLPVSQEDRLAPRDERCPMTFAPKYLTANEAWDSVGLTSFAFQTAWLYRLPHNTPLDRFEASNTDSRFKNLGPQIAMTLAVCEHLLSYPARKWPRVYPSLKQRKSYAQYVRLRGRIQVWDPATGWFAQRLPTDRNGKPLQTFVYSYPASTPHQRQIGSRLRNYLHWVLAPDRLIHRGLQSFMFKDLQLLQGPDFQFNTMYCPLPETQQDTVAYALDQQGQIVYATDYGMHGDGDPAFQCTDREIDYWDLYVPVTLFECGTVELFGLVDPDRRRFSQDVYGQWYMYWGPPGNNQDRGIDPHVRVSDVRNVATHTELSSWGFTQYQGTALVFLPASDPTQTTQPGAEILLGTTLGKFTALTNADPHGQPRGYRVARGQTIQPGPPGQSTAYTCLQQLYRLDHRRLADFAQHDVASPLADKYHRQTAQILADLDPQQSRQSWQQRLAAQMFGWNNESQAYRYVRRLLYDVVSTTVFYFVLLIPFAFLAERLLFPQRNAARTCLVAAAVFALFVVLLYIFHPGFQLAANIVVTVVAFVIVVMTLPALLLLTTRGVGMLRAIGSKALLTQRSEAERAGVVSAALSLSVSNMRRRRLRTALTLTTITVLVLALVLLTTSTTFQFRLREPIEIGSSSFLG